MGLLLIGLGVVGQIEKAFKFVKDMPFEPIGAIWDSLLGACSVHQNVEIGQYVGSRLLEIEPENAGNYVVLSNLLVSAGRWNEVRVITDSMMEKAIIKEPGKSCIELDKTLHTFHAADRSHPRMEEALRQVAEGKASAKAEAAELKCKCEIERLLVVFCCCLLLKVLCAESLVICNGHRAVKGE
ncbi:hypothetical protein POM88_042057 [Heracleum sosnowskyi]|uniref:Pentatricopeptide repeat-containing protein n=1 Tax=Heracleum sosnowskyi TaxID=360622 RepID=A0AAD8MAB4_9APIA|nr:hypothetical protein POM88_042057 [Heracleum sosnowskyi]